MLRSRLRYHRRPWRARSRRCASRPPRWRSSRTPSADRRRRLHAATRSRFARSSSARPTCSARSAKRRRPTPIHASASTPSTAPPTSRPCWRCRWRSPAMGAAPRLRRTARERRGAPRSHPLHRGRADLRAAPPPDRRPVDPRAGRRRAAHRRHARHRAGRRAQSVDRPAATDWERSALAERLGSTVERRPCWATRPAVPAVGELRRRAPARALPDAAILSVVVSPNRTPQRWSSTRRCCCARRVALWSCATRRRATGASSKSRSTRSSRTRGGVGASALG